MKTKPHSSLFHRCLVGAGGLALGCFSAASAVPDFNGGDDLAAKSDNWAELFAGSDRNSLIFQNSRLEYKGSSEWAYLRWTPSKGTYTHDWFIQVYANNGRNDTISLAVVDSKNRHKGYVISVDSSSDKLHNGLRSYFLKGNKSQYSMSSTDAAVLRIHFDSKAKTLTGSWKIHGEWAYFEPVRIAQWGMDDSSRFTAVLIGGGRTDYDDPFSRVAPPEPSGKSTPGYFSHFRCGPAAPIIDVEQPAFSDLTAGISKKSFGTAIVGGKGNGKTFTIRNNGTAPLQNLKISKDAADAADFQIADLSKTTLEIGDSTTFRVTFKPKATGTRNAAIHITSNDPDESTFDILLTGMGAN